MDLTDDQREDQFSRHGQQWQAILEADPDGVAFQVLRAPAWAPDDPRPLLVWVHPGDAAEDDHPDRGVRNRSLALQEAMALEILDRLDTHRVVVLHRLSSTYAFEPWSDHVDEDYSRAMGECLAREDVALAWGDDLDAAGAWLIGKAGVKTEAFLTGAWCHPDWGCVTAVGKTLVEAGVEVSVSGHSPSTPGRRSGGWRPKAKTGTRGTAPGPTRSRRAM